VSLPGLGPLESAVMDVIWRAGEPITGRTCRERLDYQTCDGEEPAYTTVMSILANLRKKQLLARVAPGGPDGHPGPPAWIYQARISREEYLAAVIREALACAPDQAAVLAVALEDLQLNPGARRPRWVPLLDLPDLEDQPSGSRWPRNRGAEPPPPAGSRA
jgi:predicted transcriptional regulator